VIRSSGHAQSLIERQNPIHSDNEGLYEKAHPTKDGPESLPSNITLKTTHTDGK